MTEIALLDTKICNRCQQELPTTSFYMDRKYLASSCKICSNELRKENYNRTPYNPNAKYIKEFGITLIEYNNLFEQQAGTCLICKKHQVNFKRRLAVDHCHTTGIVRGLLCSNCNLMLGHAKDNIETLQAGISYLQTTGQ